MLLGSPEPTFKLIPEYVATSGPEARELCEQSKLFCDPWQVPVVDDMLGERENHTWAAKQAALIVSRQNGKGTVGEVRVTAGIAIFEEKLIIWTAQLFSTAVEAKTRILEVFQSNPDLDREIKKVHSSSTTHGIDFFGTGRSRFTNLRTIRFMSRSKHSGRGFAGADLLVYDEAYGVAPEQAAATIPTLGTSGNPQILYLSSPPLDLTENEGRAGRKSGFDAVAGMQLFALREAAFAGSPRLAYWEWSPRENIDELMIRDEATGEYPIDMTSPEVIARHNPSYNHRLNPESVELEFPPALSHRAFLRERICAWPPKPASANAGPPPVISDAHWKVCENREWPELTDVSFGIDTGPARTKGSIVVCGYLPDGRMHFELVEYRNGVGWIPQRMRQLADNWDPICVAFDEKGNIATMLPTFKELGFQDPRDRPAPYNEIPDRGDLFIASTADVAGAASDFVDLAKADSPRLLSHRVDIRFSTAIAYAQERAIGDGLVAFGRRVSSGDISPVVAASLAARGHAQRILVAAKKYDACANVL